MAGRKAEPRLGTKSLWPIALGIVLVLGVCRLASAENVLVEIGSAARFRANASDPALGVSWIAESFDDATWTQGSYGVGYETAPPGANDLLRSIVGSNSRSVYTRSRFHVDDPDAIGQVLFGADYDDGYVAWINGVEVARSSSMPPGIPSWNTAATSHESSNASTPNYGALVDITAAARPVLHAGDNVLAVGIWNATGTSTDLVIVPKLSWGCQAQVTRGPYLQRGTSSGVVVRWRTGTATSSRVRYGTTPGALSSSTENPIVTTEHEVALVGLSPATRYYYAIGSPTETCAGDDPTHVFSTAPPTGSADPLRVWVTGDTGLGNAAARAVRDAYAAYTGNTHTDLWLLLGDNAYTDGTDAQYQVGLFDTYPEMLRTTVVWPTLGNHDGSSANSATQTGPYYDIFTLPRYAEAGGVASGTEAYYSFDWGNLHFVCLESFETDRTPSGAMLTWARNDIAATTQDWVIAFWHHPPYSKGSHNSDVEVELVQMRQNALPGLEGAGVDLVMAGHSHSYERSYLLDGHYGLSGSLSPSMKLDAGDGRIDGDGAYGKASAGPAPHQGTVYVVNGTGAQASGGSLDHPAMFDSRSELGSVVLDVRGRQLDVVALDANGVVRDHFTMVKGSPTPPTADFSGTPTDGVAPLSVQFSDLSTNTPTMWEWDFQNDGSVDASSAGPSHVFTAPGLYGVRLEARNGFGSNAAVRDAYVCVRSANGVSDVDQDGMPDGTDRCPCLADPEQMDTDGDGAGNACDADDDGDGVPDTGDCAPLDSGVGTLPSDVGDTLRPGASSDQLVWDPNVAAFAWNVYRGVVDSGAPFSYGHLCHEGESPDPETKDSEAPQSGAWFYYLVGAWNACGEGTLGAASDGTPRPSTSVCR